MKPPLEVWDGRKWVAHPGRVWAEFPVGTVFRHGAGSLPLEVSAHETDAEGFTWGRCRVARALPSSTRRSADGETADRGNR